MDTADIITPAGYVKNLDSLVHSFKIVHDSMGDIAYLLNMEDQILALSYGFQHTFEVHDPSLLLGQTFASQNIPKLSMYKNQAAALAMHNKEILNSAKKKIFIDVINYQNKADIFIVHKTPVATLDGQKFLHRGLLNI